MNRLPAFKQTLPLALVAGGLLAASTLLAAAAAQPLAPPRNFTLAQLEGDWHILAHIPYFIERNRVAPTIAYHRRADGRLDEIYRARKGGFDAPSKSYRQVTWAPDPEQPWRLKTRIFYLFVAKYAVLELDERSGIALLGTEDRDKAWIFARQPVLDDARYRRLLERFARQGYDPARIRRIPQVASDLGQPGYATIER
jgi:apolipoprotein D and lipocalin family protein